MEFYKKTSSAILVLLVLALVLFSGCVGAIDDATNNLFGSTTGSSSTDSTSNALTNSNNNGSGNNDSGSSSNNATISGGGNDSSTNAPSVPNTKLDPNSPAYAQSMAYLVYIVDAELAFNSQLIAGLEIADLLDLNQTHPLRIKLTSRIQERIDKVVNNSLSTIKELIEANQLAMALDLNYTMGTARIEQRAQEQLDAALNNPNSSVPDLIMGVQFIQQLADPNGDTTEQVKPRIAEILNSRIESVDMCVQQLDEIASIAQKIGLNELANKALRYAAESPQSCASISYTEEVKSKYSENYSLTGDIEAIYFEYDMGGYTSTQGHMYLFKSGTLNWTYENPATTGGCIIVSKSGSGTEQLGNQMDGSLLISVEDKQLTLNLTKMVKIDVHKEKVVSEDCKDTPAPNPADYQEDFAFTIMLDDTFSDNRLHLVGSLSTDDTWEDYSKTTHTTYNIRLPDQYSSVIMD